MVALIFIIVILALVFFVGMGVLFVIPFASIVLFATDSDKKNRWVWLPIGIFSALILTVILL